MADLIEATIDSIRMSLTSQQRIIVLKDSNQERYLSIWIGPYESESISIALQEIEISRPQTHDLIKNAIYELGGSVLRIIINELKDDIFYASVEILQGKKKVLLDTRPSDALALAVRTHVPIFIAEEIMQAASIVPVEEEYVSTLREETNKKDFQFIENTASSPIDTEDADRLSVFEEYLHKLDSEENQEDEDNSDDEEDDQDDDYSDGNISAI